MKHIFYSLLAVIILFTSCSKKDSVPAEKRKQLVKTTMDFGDNTEYSYDEKGRVIKIVSGDQETTFAYSGNTIHEKVRKISQNVVANEITWNLNGKGQAVSGSGIFYYPGQSPANIAAANIFDDAGYLVQTDLTINNQKSTFEYFYSGGDLTEMKTFTNNSFTGKIKYYYPGQIANKIGVGSGERQFIPGMTAFGKSGKHLYEKMERYSQTGVLAITQNYEYLLDADGYPVQVKFSGYTNNTQFYYYN